ncbi:hypothetical protein FOPG_17534 [Fusarium oxysporum f. sp. conglutinans race 2 54008]|uniref:Uncharacterized protein n=1 Tax=Fusarium oxysporum f. sp. conglutinans race 2 54008 TaxID=1089457 RepID=X0HYW5_FUSOX|nr:hypothetical protein FOPG_17534 [Fusarium oxysporum f. sp. conglutinans race 2 54008]KAG6989602.1 hypothetical protein FocnCong_v021166 [Fusarium oxysporum f. sp. conglutinans]
MRFNTFTLLFALAVWVGDVIADSKIKVEVRYSDRMVDVGNLDLFKNTWEEIYGGTGNQQSVVTDKTFKTFTKGCTSWADKPTINAQVKINGRWGRIPGVGPHDSREALVKSAWEVLKHVSDPAGWDVFTNCYGTTWQEGIPQWKGPHACGGRNPTVQPECVCSIGSAQCEHHSWGHKVPSVIQASLYRDGVLLPDMLRIEFASQSATAKGGCSQAETVGGLLAGLVPGVGTFFSTGVLVFCNL